MREVDLTIDVPQDLASCHTLIGRLASTIDTHLHTIDAHICTIDDHLHTIESHAQTILELQQQNEKLEQEKQDLELAYAELYQRAFVRRSERYLEDPNQLKIDFGGSDDAADAAEGLAQAIDESREIVVPEHTRRRHARQTRQEKFPDHIPRYEVEAAVPDELKHCPEHGQRKVIGYDRAEKLELERPKLKVRVTLYPKFACEGQPDHRFASVPAASVLPSGRRDWSRGTSTTRASLRKSSRPSTAFTCGHRPKVGPIASRTCSRAPAGLQPVRPCSTSWKPPHS